MRTGTWPTRKDSTWEKSKEWGSELSSRVCMTDWKWRVPNMTGFSSRTTSEKLRRLNQASKKQISCNLVVFGGKVLLEGSPVSNTQPVSLSRHLSARFCCKARGYQVKLKTSKAQVTLKQALRCGSRFTKFLNKMPELNWSRSVLSDSLRPRGLQPTRLLCPWDSPGKNTGVGGHFLLQGIFPTQGSNQGLPQCRQTL